MTKITLFNSMSGKEETFKPLKKSEVSIYSCGPTVYWFQHIGNLRTYIFTDILRKTFEYNNYKVKHIINVTDVGHLTSDADTGSDKMELSASKEGKTASEIANFYFQSFLTDLNVLNIKMPTKWPKASEHIKEQISMISILEKKGYTYKTSDGIYFDTGKFESYGSLSNLKIEKLKAGSRVSLGEKKNKTDFALWKFSGKEKRQQEWPSPWGVGFPGWHIECSAMSTKYLGKHFDIHTGGQEHKAVHHENEIAQSESCFGCKFANYWMHTAWLLSPDGQKVSKSKGGLYTLSDLISLGFSPIDFRYLCLQTHYKKPLKFSLTALESAQSALKKLKTKVLEVKAQKHKAKDKTNLYEPMFLKAINSDLNIPKALSIFISALNDFDFDPKKKLALLKKFDLVLSLGISDFKEEKITIPKEVRDLLKKREEARKNTDFKSSDLLREEIRSLGFEVKDKDGKQEVNKIK